MGERCLITYYVNKEQRVINVGGCFLRALLRSPFFLPATAPGPPPWGSNPRTPVVQWQGFSAFVLYGPDTLLKELSHLKLGFLEQDDEQRRVRFPLLPPHEQWRAAGPGQRTKAARGARPGLARVSPAGGGGAAPELAFLKRPEPAGRRHPRLRPRPSPSKVTLD